MTNVQTEALLVGCFYKQPDLYVKHGLHIKSKYDLSDEATRFFYNCFEIMYKTFSTDFSDTNIRVFMSQDETRLKTFNVYSGLKVLNEWRKIANIKDFENYYNTVKKYSLLREYNRRINVEQILNHSRFEELTPNDIYRFMRGKVDKINTVILSNEEAKTATDGIIDLVSSTIEIPDMGIPLPHPIINEAIRGWRRGTFGVTGMLSNEGKTRFLTHLVVNTAFKYNQKILVMLNETTEKEFKFCLLVTVLNNPEIQSLHGVTIKKKERELTQGLYRDDNGNFILRKTDLTGKYLETIQEFQDRLYQTSEEFRKVIQVSKWIEEQSKGRIFIQEMKEYDDKTLEFEIRKNYLSKQIVYFAYDTIKNDLDSIGEWASLKRTCTVLSELAKELNIALYGSIQLTDDAAYLDIFELTSNNIANAKQLKHVLDYLFLAKQIPYTDYKKYTYKPLSNEWGKQIATDLSENKMYYGSRTDKNRAGNKPTVCFCVNLDTNEWEEIGILERKPKAKDI